MLPYGFVVFEYLASVDYKVTCKHFDIIIYLTLCFFRSSYIFCPCFTSSEYKISCKWFYITFTVYLNLMTKNIHFFMNMQFTCLVWQVLTLFHYEYAILISCLTSFDCVSLWICIPLFCLTSFDCFRRWSATNSVSGAFI